MTHNHRIAIGIVFADSVIAGCADGGPEAEQQAQAQAVPAPACSGAGYERLNPTSEPVTIMLQTVGDHTLLGVV